MAEARSVQGGPLSVASFRRFWLASTLPGLGSYVTVVAVQVLVVVGAENANTMGYRQTVTPDRLQARMNTAMRSVNRGVVVIGAPLGGLLADTIGFRPALWVATAGMAAVTAGIALSPFRRVGPIDAG